MILGPLLERAALQAVTAFPHLVGETGLEARDFHDPSRQRYLTALCETRHFTASGAASGLDVAFRAGLSRQWAAEELSVAFEIPAQARDVVRQLRLDSIAERLAAELREAARTHRGGDYLQRIVDLARQAGLAAEATAAEVTDMETVARAYIADEFRRMESGTTSALSTGLNGLDRAVRGWRPAELTTLVATAGAGKSTLGTYFRRRLALRGYYTIKFAGEMSEEQEGERLVYAECATPLSQQLPAAALAEAEQRIVERGVLRRMLLKVRSRFKPEEVRATIEAEKARHGGIALVEIDHLRHLDVPVQDKSDYAFVSAAAAEAKAIAKDTMTAVLLITHLRTHGKGGGDYGAGADQEPDPSMIRGSGRIYEESDNVLALWRPNLPALHVMKARQTGVKGKKINLDYDIKTQEYSESF